MNPPPLWFLNQIRSPRCNPGGVRVPSPAAGVAERGPPAPHVAGRARAVPVGHRGAGAAPRPGSPPPPARLCRGQGQVAQVAEVSRVAPLCGHVPRVHQRLAESSAARLLAAGSRCAHARSPRRAGPTALAARARGRAGSLRAREACPPLAVWEQPFAARDLAGG